MDVPAQGYKTFSNNEMDFPLVINNPVKNPFVIPGSEKNADRSAAESYLYI